MRIFLGKLLLACANLFASFFVSFVDVWIECALLEFILLILNSLFHQLHHPITSLTNFIQTLTINLTFSFHHHKVLNGFSYCYSFLTSFSHDLSLFCHLILRVELVRVRDGSKRILVKTF